MERSVNHLPSTFPTEHVFWGSRNFSESRGSEPREEGESFEARARDRLTLEHIASVCDALKKVAEGNTRA